MKPRSILVTGLLAVLLFAACAPAASPASVEPEAVVQPAPQEAQPTVPPAAAPTDETQPQATQTQAPVEEAPTEAPQPVATSRGPDLESTAPSTVSLASGEIQLVEFFRYT